MNSDAKTLFHLKEHFCGKVVFVGIGNTLRSDDGAGSLLAQRLQGNVPFQVYDAGANLENYFGKIIREAPDTVVFFDSGDFKGSPGELLFLEGIEPRTAPLFSTHNASIDLAINYLKSNLKADIILLLMQPKDISFGDRLSSEIESQLEHLEYWFLHVRDCSAGGLSVG